MADFKDVLVEVLREVFIDTMSKFKAKLGKILKLFLVKNLREDIGKDLKGYR